MPLTRLCPACLSALALALALCAPQTLAQLRVDQPAPSQVLELISPVPVITLPAVDVAALMAEDATRDKSAPFRFGAEIALELDLLALASAEVLADGGVVYRLGLSTVGGLAVGLRFSSYDLPAGAGLWVHGSDGETLGAYTALNNMQDGTFAIQPVPGQSVVLEYVQPADASTVGQLVLDQVVHAYRDPYAKGGSYSAAGACNIDVNCASGQPWQKEKRAVARILSGGALCTGSLINNSANNGTQYFWTANHCGGMNNAVFLFNYEKSGCGSGGASSSQSVQGSVLVANNSSVDYRLVRITETIPDNYNVYYLGWNRSSSAPSNTITIHHPSGDVKKISFDNQAPTKSGTDWRIAQWDLGVTEGGSSGCPLMDPQGRMIGQLCCGAAYCGYPYDDFYGRFELAWSGVSSSLDPLGSGATAILGFDPDFPGGGSGTWTSLGGGLTGLLGIPTLVGSGPLTAASSTTLTETGTLTGATAHLIVGLSVANIPFKGGVIVPSLDILVLGLTAAGGGVVSLTSPWPAGMPTGTNVYFQIWNQDFTGPQGLTASNALRATTP